MFQLKNLVKNYYEKKTKMSKELLETLDVMLNQRPATIQMKKRSFNREGEEPDEPAPGPPQGAPKKHKNFHIDLECMRLNAEKDRIQHYKDLAVSSAI